MKDMNHLSLLKLANSKTDVYGMIAISLLLFDAETYKEELIKQGQCSSKIAQAVDSYIQTHSNSNDMQKYRDAANTTLSQLVNNAANDLFKQKFNDAKLLIKHHELQQHESITKRLGKWIASSVGDAVSSMIGVLLISIIAIGAIGFFNGQTMVNNFEIAINSGFSTTVHTILHPDLVDTSKLQKS